MLRQDPRLLPLMYRCSDGARRLLMMFIRFNLAITTKQGTQITRATHLSPGLWHHNMGKLIAQILEKHSDIWDGKFQHSADVNCKFLQFSRANILLVSGYKFVTLNGERIWVSFVQQTFNYKSKQKKLWKMVWFPFFSILEEKQSNKNLLVFFFNIQFVNIDQTKGSWIKGHRLILILSFYLSNRHDQEAVEEVTSLSSQEIVDQRCTINFRKGFHINFFPH